VVEALANAGVEADSITYLEAHGSGTPVGDPIEVRALTKAFRTFTQRSGYCAIGSVKTNVGHLDAAAAVAGIIKTVLALEHRQVPPSLHFTEANPEIDFPASPFYVNTRLREWTGDGPRRAGVMSTGMGGTNAHVVLEEAPQPAASTDAGLPHLLILSAKTETALDQATHRLREFLKRNDSVSMGDVAYTLQVGRKAYPHRRCLVCVDREDAVAALGQGDSKRVVSGRTEESRRPVILLLPGIGDQYVGMAHDLYETWPVFRQAVDRCAQGLEPHLGIDIRSIMYPRGQGWKKQHGQSKGIDLKKMLGRNTAEPMDQDAQTLNQTLFAQPALFTIEYAMTRLWQSLGVAPDAVVGHSMGEYVAACLAGVMSLDDALRLIATRARLVNDLPQGGMLAVTLSEDELLPLLPKNLSISLINGPRLCVVAGPVAEVAEFERMLSAQGIICRHVQNAHAFHSRMLEPIVQAFEEEVKQARLHEPTIPYISNVTGTWITRSDATNPAYWATHAIRTARFSDALREVWRFKHPVLLDAGPGRTLGVLALQHPDRRNGGDPVAVSSIRHDYENRSDVEFLWHGIGRLWLSGAEIQWDQAPSGGRRRMPLPTYPFERQHYWIEAKSESSVRRSENPGLDNWFYVPTWERTPFPSELRPTSRQQDALWLIISDRYGGGRGLKAKLDNLQLETRFVCFGEQFVQRADGSFELNPASPGDYLKLLRELQGRATSALHIVHLGSVTRDEKETGHPLRAANQNFGFYSLLHLAQAVGELDISVPIKIGIISNRLHEVTGEERLDPEMTTVLGPCGVIPKEFPNVECFNVDLADSQAIENLPDDVVAAILSEFAEPPQSQVVAYRGRYRWERRYEPVKLPNERATIRRLRQGGVYLITGGTGGLGLAVAKHLAAACQPTLVLTKKTPFPDKSAWQELLTARDTPARVIKTIQALLDIEKLGARVEILVAEASDREQMQKALNGALKKFGTIHGVIHAAGIVRAGLIQAKTRDTAESVLAPKVYGTMILFDLLKKTKLDFFVLFSSITTVSTPYAECDYSAANAFLDAFTYFSNAQQRFHTLTINWPGWKEVGQLAELEALPGVEAWKQAALEKAIATEAGLEVFKRVLNSDLKQVVVSPESLDHLLAQSRAPFDPAMYLPRTPDAPRTPPRRGGQEDGGGQPASEVETALADIWSGVFGFEHISRTENFADLGGHSLLAMQIVSQIRSLYRINFTLREFFEAPTIAQLSSVVEGRILAEIETLTDRQARALLSDQGRP